MKQAHFIVQGKGGVGKSLIASMLAQYLTDFSGSVISCFDTDPVNPTFSRYQALNVETINILNEQNNINKREFDTLVERLADDSVEIAVIDNGAATFIPLMSYIFENSLLELLNDSGIEVVFHIPLYGGDALEDTIQGLMSILEQLNASKVIVWLNHNQNLIAFDGGHHFHELGIYKKNTHRILGTVELKQRNAETFGVDIKEMTQRHLTVAEVKANADKRWKLTEIQRINLFYKDICEQLHQIPLFAESTTE